MNPHHHALQCGGLPIGANNWCRPALISCGVSIAGHLRRVRPKDSGPARPPCRRLPARSPVGARLGRASMDCPVISSTRPCSLRPRTSQFSAGPSSRRSDRRPGAQPGELAVVPKRRDRIELQLSCRGTSLIPCHTGSCIEPECGPAQRPSRRCRLGPHDRRGVRVHPLHGPFFANLQIFRKSQFAKIVEASLQRLPEHLCSGSG